MQLSPTGRSPVNGNSFDDGGPVKRRKLEDLNVFLSFDYSQIEIRLLAEVSGDPLLIKQFNSGVDIHCLVGNTLTGWSIESIASNKQVRRSIKEFHFALVYGVGKPHMFAHMTARGVTGITPELVSQYYDAYFKKYKGVKAFIDRMRKQGEEQGFVETIFKFRRDIRQNDETRQTFSGNQSVNTPIQGAAHQLLLIMMAMLHIKPRTYNLLQNPLMEVHDQLIFQTPLGVLPKTYAMGKQLMEKDVVAFAYKKFGVKLRVPLIAEASAGFCMGSMVEDYEGEPVSEFLTKWRAKHREIEAKPLADLAKPRGV